MHSLISTKTLNILKQSDTKVAKDNESELDIPQSENTHIVSFEKLFNQTKIAQIAKDSIKQENKFLNKQIVEFNIKSAKKNTINR